MTQKRNDEWISGVIYAVLFLVGLYAVLSLFFGQAGFPYLDYTVFTTCVFGVLFALFFLISKGKTRIFLLLGILGAWLIAGYLMRDRFAQGAEVAASYLGPYLSRITQLEFITPILPSAEEGRACADFCIWLFVPYTAFMAWAVVARKSCLLSLLCTIPLFAFSYGNLMLPSGVSLALLFVFWIAMILQSRVFRLNKNIRPGFSAVCITLVAALFLTLFALYPQETYAPSQNATGLRVDISNAAADLGYRLRGLSGFPSGVPLSSSDGTIDLKTAGSVQLPDRTVLRVHSERPATQYLRGYSASVYTGHEWLQPEDDAFQNANIPFDPLMYLGTNGILRDTGITNKITIEPDRTDSNFLFTPYLMTGLGVTVPAWNGDAYLEGGGQASYSFETFDAFGDTFISPQNEDALWSVQMNLSPEGNMISITSEFEGYTIHYEFYPDGGYGVWSEQDDISDDVIQRALESIPELTSNDDLRPSSPEADYRAYIASEYTQLPDGLKEELLDWWRSRYAMNELSTEMQPFYAAEGDIPYKYWKAAAKLVAQEVSASGTYTTEPGPQPQNRDFVEYFLTESNKGYCTHFASATTAMLRALGIPARYVEGYIVGESSFGDDGWAEVSANKAHAWAEIWAPGIGWVPVESTPSGAAVSQLPDSANGAQTQTDGLTPTPTPTTAAPTPTPTPTPSPMENADGSASEATARENDLLFLLILCGSAVALVLICRQVVRVKRLNGFEDLDPDRAALFVYAYLSELQAYGVEISQEATDIARKAKFSRELITEDELARLKNEAEKSKQTVLQTMPPIKKVGFWFKGL